MGANDAADQFVDDLASRGARHKQEADVAFASMTQLNKVEYEVQGVKDEVKALRSDVHGVKKTLEGSVEGTVRTYGIIDIVSTQGATMKSIKGILYAIFTVLALDFGITILQRFGFLSEMIK